MSLNSRALLLVLCLLGATEVFGQEAVTALDRTLSKTHMRQDTTSCCDRRRASASIRSHHDSVWKAELHSEG